MDSTILKQNREISSSVETKSTTKLNFQMPISKKIYHNNSIKC